MTLVRNAEGTGKAQLVGVIILAVLVGITQVVSIILSDLRQKKANNIADGDIPEYRKQKNQDPQAKTTANTMKFMLYFMAAMMVVFVWQSPAGLGLYWVIGNIYSTLQTTISQLPSVTTKRINKLKEKARR